MRARYEITPPAARLAVKLFQANDTGGTLKGHGEKQHAVFQAEFLGFLVGGVIQCGCALGEGERAEYYERTQSGLRCQKSVLTEYVFE